jgi:hypothetical protein
MVRLPASTKTRPETPFRREFLLFLRAVGFKLADFLPNRDFFDNLNSVDKNCGALKLPMFPDFLINRATGFEKLRGNGPFGGQLAAVWEKRANLFLRAALKRNGRLQLDGISFVVSVNGRPRVDRTKLISVYRAGKPFLTSVTRETSFKRQFNAFLAELGFNLRNFFPETKVKRKADEEHIRFPQCIISRATGWERLRGQGPMNQDLAAIWAERANLFISEALTKDGNLELHPFSFVIYVDGRPKISPQKLIAVYQQQREGSAHDETRRFPR